MGTFKVEGDISASNTISATSFFSAPLYKTTKEVTAAPEGTAEGWYRCATLSSKKGASNNFMLSIRRSYYSPSTSINITQISGSIGGHLLTKIRANIASDETIYIDYYMKSNGVASYKNTWYISGWGDGEIYAPYLVSSYTGTVTELNTVAGMSNTNGFSGNATSASSVPWSGITGKPSTFAPSSHTHDYLSISGGTMSGSPVIKFPASAGSIATSDPMAITYGRISCYGTLCINANTDNNGTEYVILTAGKGLSSSTSDGLAIGTSTLTWQGATVLTSSNFPAASSLARQTDTWISASSLDVNTYYPVVIDIPYQGLCRIKLAVQLNSGTKPSWSTHNVGFTSNIDVEIIAAGWGTVSSYRYLLRQDDWNFSNVKPAYFAGQLTNASKAVFYVRGGGSYRFICDWQDASISLRTSSSTYNSQTVEPTTSTSVFHSGSKSHLYCNVDYASSAGNADTLDGSHASAFASASHSHSYLPLSGGTMTGALNFANGTWNNLGDDVRFGDQNVAGTFAIEGLNGNTTLQFNQYGTSTKGTISFYGNDFHFSTWCHIPTIVTSAYGSSFPTAYHAGQIFFKT